MMNIEIIPFNDLYLSDFVYDGIENIYATDKEIKAAVSDLAKRGEAYMAIVDNRPIAISGVFPISETTGQAWLFFNQEARLYIKTILNAINKYTDDIVKRLGYKKIEIACLKNSFEAKNLAEHLGFSEKVEFILYQKNVGE